MKKYLNKQNIIYSQGGGQYFQHKKSEKDLGNEDLVYVSFKTKDGGIENMWVQIISGNQKKGYGLLSNFPSNDVGYDFDDQVYYVTKDDGITRLYKPSKSIRDVFIEYLTHDVTIH